VNILLIALGSAGDVHPIVGLGLALRERGHKVSLAANPYHELLVRRVGLPFESVGTREDYLEAMADPNLWHPLRGTYMVIERLMLPLVEPLFAMCERFAAKGDAVIAAPATALGARVAQEKLGIPLVTLHLQPAALRSMCESPVIGPMLLGDGVPRWLKRLQFGLADALIADRLINRQLTPFRARHGLAPVRHVMGDWWNSTERVIGLFPDWFATPQPDWPRQVVLTGFPLWDEQGYSAVPAGLEAFLAEGTPPIVFTPGSAMLHGQEFFRAGVEACRLLGRRGILLTRFPEQLPAHLPADVRHFDFVSLGALLPRSAAIVHHAGIGTLAQGLAAGIPHLAMPMSHDQPDNAARLGRLGVGLSLRPQHFRAARVAAALDRLLADRAVQDRCRDLAARFDTRAALERTCREIEKVGERPRLPG
jgi:rhamnosyltransferase subunit B